MRVVFGVLGPVAAWDGDGNAIALKGPRHRAVLARLVVARRRVVPVGRLVEDLWEDPPEGAVSAVRTFVAALRRALEPDRPPRSPARLLVTEGPGYALRAEPDSVDAWRFERAVAAAGALRPEDAVTRLGQALESWRGPAYADFPDEPWACAERARLAEVRLRAVEERAGALLASGRAAAAVPDLDAHVAEHPWREDAWRLLALALYRAGRQGDALAVLRRARALLAGRLGVDPGPALRRLEADILGQAEHLDPAGGPGGAAGRVWAEAAAAYDRTVASGARARLESTVGLLRDLAVTGGGGLEEARRHRVAAVRAAEELGDPELTARVIGAFDVPAVWTRVDDPAQSAYVVGAAGRALVALPGDAHDAARARLLAVIAVESRGTASARGSGAASEAERIARGLDDPALLAFALDGVFMQSFARTGLAARREAIGAELIALSSRRGLVTFEVLGHLIRLQACGALGDFAAADRSAEAADRLAERHERPLVEVFTRWYRVMRRAADTRTSVEAVEADYRDAARLLDGAGMPGLTRGLPSLASLCLRVGRGLPAAECAGGVGGVGDAGDAGRGGASGGASGPEAAWGPYGPWARPWLLLARGRRDAAAAALRDVPDPPHDLLMEALWCLIGRAGLAVGDRGTMDRAYRALVPAAGELAAGSGLLTVGPVAGHLDALAAALGRVR